MFDDKVLYPCQPFRQVSCEAVARAMKGFFSYARVDAEAPLDGAWVDRVQRVLAAQVQAELGDHDFAVWQDRKALLFGDDWRDEIEQAVRAAPFFFVLLTPGWIKSAWCRKEFDLFRAVHPGRHAFVIRFREVQPQDRDIEPHKSVLEQLRLGQHVNLQNPLQRNEDAITRILDKMAQDLALKVRENRSAALDAVAGPGAAANLPTSPPVPLTGGRQIVDGYFDMPSQSSNRVLLDVGFIERAVIELRGHGRVIFSATAATLTTTVSSGRITDIRTDFARGYSPPRTSVVVQPTAGRVIRHFDIRNRDGSPLSGNPLRDRNEPGGPVELFSVEGADGGLKVGGHVTLDISGLHVEEDQAASSAPADQAARQSQLRKLAELVLKKHGSVFHLGDYRRDAP